MNDKSWADGQPAFRNIGYREFDALVAVAVLNVGGVVADVDVVVGAEFTLEKGQRVADRECGFSLCGANAPQSKQCGDKGRTKGHMRSRVR